MVVCLSDCASLNKNADERVGGFQWAKDVAWDCVTRMELCRPKIVWLLVGQT